MSGVRHVEGDESFLGELAKAGDRLVVVHFTASWCGPCKRIAPVFAELAAEYSHNLFLDVDVDECPQTANDNKVQAMPTFMFFKNGQKIDSIRGADPEALESKVQELGGDKPKVEAVMVNVIASSKNTNSNASTGAASVAPPNSMDTGAAGGGAEGGAAGGGPEAGAARGGASGGEIKFGLCEIS